MGLHALLIVAAGAVAAPGEREDMAKEVERAVRTLQTAFDKGDVDTVRGLMTDDHTTVLPYARFHDREDQLKLLSEFRFSEYKIEGLKVKAITGDVALVTYRAMIRGTFKWREVPSSVAVGEVWVKRDGKWMQSLYQETPLDRN
jgi:ketosteroid isomerase-like protein